MTNSPITIKVIFIVIELLAFPFLLFFCLLSRILSKSIDVGLGPTPLINNVYHKKALEKYGYKAETFVNQTYFITSEFDINPSLTFKGPFKVFIPYILFIRCLMKYKCVYLYFDGGPFCRHIILKKIEPKLFKLANIKTVVMPYGGDVQNILNTPNLLYRHSLINDYPIFTKYNRLDVEASVNRWSKNADYIIAGCDWVYYLHHWDKLILAHFSIDLDRFKLPSNNDSTSEKKPIKILHAPNHKKIKGSSFFLNAVKELKDEGYQIELELIEKVPNHVVIEKMREADIIADQLIVGWYAMTAIEAMSLNKPVLCYLDDNLIDLYHWNGLVSTPDEIPIINCNFKNVKDKIKFLLENPQERAKIGSKGRDFVQKFHSLEAIGLIFDEINKKLIP